MKPNIEYVKQEMERRKWTDRQSACYENGHFSDRSEPSFARKVCRR